MYALASGGTSLIVVASIFQFLAIAAVALRVWARRLNGRKFDTSDWLVFASLIITTILTAIVFAGVVIGGAGYHQDEIASGGSSTAALDRAAKIVFMAEMLWLLTNAFTKLSTLAFYLSIFRISRFRYLIYAVMGLTVACLVAFIIKDFLICRPVSRNWTFEGGDFCGITTSGTIATGVGVTVVDIIIVVLPMPLLLQLQMRPMKKFMICGIFSLGLIVCVISGLRLESVLQINQQDLTYSIVPLGIYTLLEPLLGIIVASLPTLHPVLVRCFKSDIFDWTRRGSRKGSASGKRSAGTDGSATLAGTGNDTRNFNRLYDHLYPITVTTITDKLSDEEHGEAWQGGGPTEMHDLKPSGISVTREFKMQSIRISNANRVVLSKLQTLEEDDNDDESEHKGKSKAGKDWGRSKFGGLATPTAPTHHGPGAQQQLQWHQQWQRQQAAIKRGNSPDNGDRREEEEEAIDDRREPVSPLSIDSRAKFR